MTSRAMILVVAHAAVGLAQNTGSVVGIVRDSVTNVPIPGANARLKGAATYVATAGPDGRFRFDGLPEGKYKMDAYQMGYVGPSTWQDLDIASGGVVRL